MLRVIMVDEPTGVLPRLRTISPTTRVIAVAAAVPRIDVVIARLEVKLDLSCMVIAFIGRHLSN
jgi:hypothetical protein